jgi:GxxExxY protein
MDENSISKEIIGAAIEVHKILGPGLLESAYQECLERELSLRKIIFEKEKPIPIEYKGLKLDCGYRADFLVGKLVVVELKSVEKLLPIHQAQVLTYLKLLNIKLGILLNFNVPMLKEGIKRIALKL